MSDDVIDASPADAPATAPWFALIVTDVDGRILDWSQGAERLYGWTRQEVVGLSVLDVIVPSAQAQDAATIMEQLGEPSSQGWEGPFPVKRRNGAIISVYVRDRPIVVDGTVVAIVGESAPVLSEATGAEPARLSDDVRAALDALMGSAELSEWSVDMVTAATSVLLRLWAVPTAERTVLAKLSP